MIIHQKKYKLTPENVLARVSEYEIYRHYTGREFVTGSAFCSPLREDRNPSFVISCKNGEYFHLDYANSQFRGNCFQFVQQKFNISFDQALLKIDQDFNLGLSSKKIKTFERPVYDKPETEEKPTRIIQVEPKFFTPKELSWWADYYIGLPELKVEDIYSVGKLYLDKQRFSLDTNEMVFGYLYENKYWKIYRPLLKAGKWMSTVPLQVVDGLDRFRNVRNGICAKGKKDKIILSYFLPAISVQNESIAAFSDDTVTWINGEVRGSMYVAFDSDEPGKKASHAVTAEFGFKHVNIPDHYLQEGIKDFADLARVYGLKTVQNYLKSKEII
jgi:hypothetical protein